VIHASDELSVNLKRVLIDQFTPEALAELAVLRRAEEPRIAARRRLTTDGLEELATMLLGGQRPTLGWWRRHRA
jgi:hypothetical protein